MRRLIVDVWVPEETHSRVASTTSIWRESEIGLALEGFLKPMIYIEYLLEAAHGQNTSVTFSS